MTPIPCSHGPAPLRGRPAQIRRSSACHSRVDFPIAADEDRDCKPRRAAARMYFYFSEAFHGKVLPSMANQVHQSKGKSAVVIPDSLFTGFPQAHGTIAELIF
jgi:hypothetical protein